MINLKAKWVADKVGLGAGFTVLELMVSMGIMAVMAAIATPNYISYIPKSRVNGAARMVMTDLLKAKMNAVKLNTKTKVFRISCHEYQICDDANGDGTVDQGEGNAVTRNIHDEYSDVYLWFHSNINFSPRGTAKNDCSCQTGEVWVWNYSGEKRIRIDLSGNIKIDFSYSYI